MITEKLQTYLNRCEERSALNAWTYVDAEGSMHAAAEADERVGTGLERPLEGLVIGVKDNISLVGMPLTCSSNILKGFQPVYNATVIERLHDAGAIFLGKTNMDEFAMGSSTEHSAFGPSRNPIDPLRVPGGSSGGSAVAVADGQCDVALGSETGGSVRQPAAFCGVYGLKPTYGRLSRYGLVAFASSLDQIGIFSRTVDDMARTFDVVAAHDPMDATSHPQAAGRAVEALAEPPSDFTVGVLPDSLLAGCDAEIIAAYHRFVETLKGAGGTAVEIELPNLETWIPTYFILATAEASSNLARYDGVRYGFRAPEPDQDDMSEKYDMTTESRSGGFGKEVKRRIMLGTYVLSSGYYDAYYKKAQQMRRLIADAYSDIFSKVDIVAMPTTPTTAFKIGEITDPVKMWLSDLYTVSANIAGIPALSVPFGADSNNLPIGMQLQSPMMTEERLFQIAKRIA